MKKNALDWLKYVFYAGFWLTFVSLARGALFVELVRGGRGVFGVVKKSWPIYDTSVIIVWAAYVLLSLGLLSYWAIKRKGNITEGDFLLALLLWFVGLALSFYVNLIVVSNTLRPASGWGWD
jgi:hypothetical protein